jgi:hypothetical protein
MPRDSRSPDYSYLAPWIDRLPAKWKPVAEQLLAGKTHSEAGLALGISRGSVSIQVHRIGKYIRRRDRTLAPPSRSLAPLSPATRCPARPAPPVVVDLDADATPAILALRERIANEKAGTNAIRPVPLTPEERTLASLPLYPDDERRPRKRSDCIGGQRPCPWVSCEFHLYLDVSESGSILINHPDKDPGELRESCVLDVADRGGETLVSIGQMLGITRERVRQIEEATLRKIAKLADSSDRPIDRHHSPLGEAQVG